MMIAHNPTPSTHAAIDPNDVIEALTGKHNGKVRQYCKLWPLTLELLKEYRSSHPRLVLISQKGNPLQKKTLFLPHRKSSIRTALHLHTTGS